LGSTRILPPFSERGRARRLPQRLTFRDPEAKLASSENQPDKLATKGPEIQEALL
jgi:hypothetical protein